MDACVQDETGEVSEFSRSMWIEKDQTAGVRMQLEPPLLEVPAGQSVHRSSITDVSVSLHGRSWTRQCLRGDQRSHVLLHPDDAVSELVLVPAGHVAQLTPLPVVNVFTGQAIGK